MGASNTKVSDTQIVGFGSGIQIQGTSGKTTGVHCSGSNVEAYRSCVVISPSVFDLCFFWTATFPGVVEHYGDDLGGGIAIGMGGGLNADDRHGALDLVQPNRRQQRHGCKRHVRACRSGGPEHSGSRRALLGQRRSTGGIAIVGGAIEVQVVGANCRIEAGNYEERRIRRRFTSATASSSPTAATFRSSASTARATGRRPSGPSSSAFPRRRNSRRWHERNGQQRAHHRGAQCTRPVFGNGDIAQGDRYVTSTTRKECW